MEISLYEIPRSDSRFKNLGISFSAISTLVKRPETFICHRFSLISLCSLFNPSSIIISILGIAALYFVMNLSLISVIPWREAMHSKYIVSEFMERVYGVGAARVVTGLILVAAFASVWSLLLGYSRIPYAAALDGGFFRLFAQVHPQKRFPHVSLLAVGGVTVAFSLVFKLLTVIKALMAIRILIEFVAQAVAVFVLHRAGAHFPFRMWLYPLPALVAVALWLGLFVATGERFILIGLGVLAAGVAVYLLRARLLREFPFADAFGVAK